MKKVFFFVASTVLFGTLFLASCAKEEEPETDPNADPRAKFNGNWSITENSKDYGASTYNVTISDSSNTSHILFSYLYGFNKKVYATVSGKSFEIPSQGIQGNNVSGEGVLVNTNQINMTYFVQSTTTHFDTITATLTK